MTQISFDLPKTAPSLQKVAAKFQTMPSVHRGKVFLHLVEIAVDQCRSGVASHRDDVSSGTKPWNWLSKNALSNRARTPIEIIIVYDRDLGQFAGFRVSVQRATLRGDSRI